MIAQADVLLAFTAAASLGIGAVGLASAVRAHAAARHDRLALRLAVEREAVFVESARRLADAARTSIVAVREEMQHAVRAIAPGIDAMLFFEEVEGQLVCVAADGARVDYFTDMRCALDDDRSLLVTALRANHRATAREHPTARALHPGDTFAAAIPLVLEAGRRCVLYVGGADVASYASVDRIVRLVDGATPAYRIAYERAEDRARAEYDGLTGLLTARAFRTQLTQRIERARFQPLGRLSLLFLDTDRFKAWNDTYGHACGDALLRELAQSLRAAANQPGDLVARNGGDEFCVVFADAEKSNAIERAQFLRAAIASADVHRLHAHLPVAEDVRISVSIGVASFPFDAQSPEALLEKADEAMYHSKKTGRNGVSFYRVDATLTRADGAAEERTADRRRD